MYEFTSEEIEKAKKLRKETGQGLMDCKYALKTFSGDYQKAKEYLYDRKNRTCWI